MNIEIPNYAQGKGVKMYSIFEAKYLMNLTYSEELADTPVTFVSEMRTDKVGRNIKSVGVSSLRHLGLECGST